MQNRLFKTHKYGSFLPFFDFDFLGFGKHAFKFPFNIKDGVIITYPYSAFKMKNKASVIHINRTHGGYLVIRNEKL